MADRSCDTCDQCATDQNVVFCYGCQCYRCPCKPVCANPRAKGEGGEVEAFAWSLPRYGIVPDGRALWFECLECGSSVEAVNGINAAFDLVYGSEPSNDIEPDAICPSCLKFASSWGNFDDKDVVVWQTEQEVKL